jgi:hypothetical protein
MAGLLGFVPFRVVLTDQIDQIFLGFNVGDTGKIIDVAVAYLAAVFHEQSALQQHSICPQKARFLVAKQRLFPSASWIFLIKSFLEYFQVSLIPKSRAFFSINKSLIPPPLFFG